VGRQTNIEIYGFDVVQKKFSEDAELFLEVLKEFKHYRNDKYAEVLIGKNKWILHDEWQKAIEMRNSGTITKKQQEILDDGHWNHE